MSLRFDVDLDELESVVDEIDALARHISEELQQVAGVVADLHLTWSGEAATAHAAAHQRWTEGAQQMHQGLTDLHAAAALAHGNYHGAAQANASMLEQTR